jgi:Kef-type K+ transport system membrane component KefB
MEAEHLAEHVTRIILQLSIILIAAKFSGEFCERFLKIPPVLGELAAGIIIGPYALGGMSIGSLGPIFALKESVGVNPLSNIPQEIWVIGQIAAVILLFVAGLETDLKQFLRYIGPALLVALGGVVLPFALGVSSVVLIGDVDRFSDPQALFMGALMTATSVGITARVLADLGKLNTPEGVTIIGSAVIDDVLGILILSIVVGITESGGTSAGEIARIASIAIGFWVTLTGIMLLTATRLFRFISGFRVSGAPLVLALALAFLGAGLAELAGLAMIIGAYSVGLGLSTTPLRRLIEEPLTGLYHGLVPVFFVVMGMLVDVTTMGNALVFGIVFTILAIFGKIVGSGTPALITGFNPIGAWRIGLGMMPRGEVALIIAGIGLSRGVIGPDLFGVSILMTVITTLLAPLLLVPAFRKGGPGHRDKTSSLEQ